MEISLSLLKVMNVQTNFGPCVRIWVSGISAQACTAYTKSFDDAFTECGW